MAYKKLKYWFDELLADKLAGLLADQNIKFSKDTFLKQIREGIVELELKDRVELFADALNDCLEGNYQEKINKLLRILGPENKEETGMFVKFYWVMPIAKYVEKYGIEDYKTSFDALEEITKRNTGEYAIRAFLIRYPKASINKMYAWSKSSNHHLRRLASEGGRPRLPWASKLDPYIKDPSPLLPILNRLKDDPSGYVRKSVANCINDILKDNPDVAQSLLTNWADDPTDNTRWIIKHALRNELKKNVQWAIQLYSRIQS